MCRVASIIFTLLALCLSPTTNNVLAGEEMVTVVADGYSYLGDNDTIKTARERALAEAERNAVEQGSYSYLESQTTVKNYQVISDEIKSRVKGAITNKKILLDEMDKATLRYHIRLEAQVKFADLKSLLEQPEASISPAQDQPPPTQATLPVPDTIAPRRKPAKQEHLSTQRQLRRLRNKHPHRYIQLMTRFQPKLNDTETFIARLRRVQARHPEAGRKIRKTLRKTPIQGKGKSELTERIGFLRTKRPRDYILMIEMLFPEIRPRAMDRHWLQIREGERQAFTASSSPAPYHQ